MRFAWPAALLLLLVPLLLIFRSSAPWPLAPRTLPRITRGRVRRGRIVVDRDRHGAPDTRIPWLYTAALVCCILALARPQWGVPRGQAADDEVLIALDLSRSMSARDVAPSRLERARTIAAQMIDQLPDRRIGLIGFAGAAYLIDAASRDHAALLATLAHLTPDDLSQPGTDFTALIDAALPGFGANGTARSLVLLSDGEAQFMPSDAALGLLRQAHVRVFAVGIGSARGARVPGPDGRWLQTAAGAPVESHLNGATLARMAEYTHGRYRDLDHAGALTRDVAANVGGEAGGDAALGTRAERFHWFLSAALLLLAGSCVLEFPALPTLAWLQSRAAPLAALAAAVLVAGVTLGPARSGASQPSEADDEDVAALAPLEATVSALLAKRTLTAADYLELARATVRYGDVQRNQAADLVPGILSDGTSAIRTGRALAPSLGDWDGLEAALQRLGIAPPPLPDDGKAADAANQRVAGRREAPQLGGPGQRGAAQRAAGDASADTVRDRDSAPESAVAQTLHSVGGSRRQVYDAAEWRDPSLVLPLHQLDELRKADSPTALLRTLQSAATGATPAPAQTW